MPYVLALDQGTTSSRAILFDHDGGIAGVALPIAAECNQRHGLGPPAGARGGAGPLWLSAVAGLARARRPSREITSACIALYQAALGAPVGK